VVVIDTAGSVALSLNRTAGGILKQVTETDASALDIAAWLSSNTGVGLETARADVSSFLDRFREVLREPGSEHTDCG